MGATFEGLKRPPNVETFWGETVIGHLPKINQHSVLAWVNLSSYYDHTSPLTCQVFEGQRNNSKELRFTWRTNTDTREINELKIVPKACGLDLPPRNPGCNQSSPPGLSHLLGVPTVATVFFLPLASWNLGGVDPTYSSAFLTGHLQGSTWIQLSLCSVFTIPGNFQPGNDVKKSINLKASKLEVFPVDFKMVRIPMCSR